MDIYNFDYKVKQLNQTLKNHSTLLIGKFDIFHIGHKKLLDEAKIVSKKNKIGITLFQDNDNKEIVKIENRLNNLAQIGFDFVILINFDFEFKSLNAKDFINHIIKKYNVENIIVGKDFRLGKNRMWSSKELQDYFKNTSICDIETVNNIKISSSSIREMITTGEIKLINELSLTKYNPTIQYINNKLIWNDNLIKPHSGIFYIKMIIENYLYHGLLHISIKNSDSIILLNYDDNLIDDFYTIEIFEESRIIINSRFDNITEEDKKNCLEFFYLLQKNNI